MSDASIFNSKLSDQASTNKKSSKKQPSGPDNNRSKRGFPFWLLIFLLLLFTTGISARSQKLLNAAQILTPGVGIEEIASSGTSGLNGVDGINGEKGANGNDGRSGDDGEKGQDGSVGSKGADGAAGAAGLPGVDGVDGTDGSNDCISGICVSRQVGSPGTQEAGNINIDGKVLATQIGINDTTPSNTLTVNGTADVQGHSAFGAGSAVNGATFLTDAFGVTQHNATISNYETLTNLSSGTVSYEGSTNAVTLNPSGAPSYYSVNGLNGVVQVASGNAQDFGSQLVGGSLAIQHGGSGDITLAIGSQSAILKMSTGDITTASGVKSTIVNANASGEITTANGFEAGISFNAGTIGTYNGLNITSNTATVGTNRGVYIQSATGTKTNNYGLYIEDQSGAGSSNSYNIYSAGASSKNFFGGNVGIGNLNPNSNLEIWSSATDTSAQTIIANSLTSGTGLAVFSSATAFTGDLGKFEASGNDAGVTGHSLKVGMTGASSTGSALTVTNAGSGNIALFNDDGTYSDTSPFVISSTGQVGIGTTALGNRKLRVDGVIEASKVFFRAGADNDLYSSIFYDGADNMKYTAYDAHAFFTETGSGLTQKMIIDGNGNVGIGADTPGVKLDVNGVIRGTRFSGVSGSTTWLSSDGSATGLFVTDAANPQTGANRSFHITANGGQAVPAFSVTGGSIGQIVALVKGAPSQTANLQEWQNSSDTPVGYVTATGTLAQSGATNCAVSANASGELQCTSDERLKDVQGLYDGGLEQLNSINTIRYNFKNEDYTHVGFSAQNVGAVLPEGTPLQANGFLGLDSNAILALTVNSVKELSLDVDSLGVDFASALEQTQGNVDEATELLASQGLQLNQLSDTLQDYASQLAELNDRVNSLEAEIQSLKEQNQVAPIAQEPSPSQ